MRVEPYQNAVIVILILWIGWLACCSSTGPVLTPDQRLYAVQFEYNRLAQIALDFIGQHPTELVNAEFKTEFKQLDEKVHSNLQSAELGLLDKSAAAGQITASIQQLKHLMRTIGVEL